MKRLLLLLTFFFAAVSFGQDRILKEMGWEKQGAAGKVKILDKYLIRLDDSTYSNPRWALEKGRIAYHAAGKIEYYKGEVYGVLAMCKCHIFLNDFDSSLHYAKLAMTVANKSKDPALQIQAHNITAGVLSYMGKYDKAAEEYFLTYKLAKKHDEGMAVIACANLGHVFHQIGNFVKSREYSERALRQAVQRKDTVIVLMSLNLIGLADYHEKKFQDGLHHYKEALKYAVDFGDAQHESQVHFNLADVYLELKEYDKALESYQLAIELSKSSESHFSIAERFISLTEIYLRTKRLQEAAPIIDSAFRYAWLSGDIGKKSEVYKLKAKFLNLTGRYALAYAYLDSAFILKDSTISLQLNQTILNSEEEFDKQQKALKDSLAAVQRSLKEEHSRKINDQKIRSREILLWISGIALLLVIFGLSRLYKSNRLIRTQKEEIQGQHKEITDSIQYALRIQQATLPKEWDFERISQDNFVFFSPKDVVSGDFYWMHVHEASGLKIWAVADCTGHGVPGGFMSMLGIGLLNEIVVESGKTDPGNILNELRDKILTALKQSDEHSTRDGMDIALCAWDEREKMLHFAGANNPMWLLRSAAATLPEVPHKLHQTDQGTCILEILPDKMPIGFQQENPPPFRTRTLHVESGDLLVLFSDGFADQFGGAKNKKFGYPAMRTILLQNSTEELSKVGQQLAASFHTWKGAEDQTDDVCVLGIRLKT